MRGGVENGHVVHLGRISYGGEVVVGKIATNSANNAPLFFVDKYAEKKTKSYEMLLYESDYFPIEPRFGK